MYFNYNFLTQNGKNYGKFKSSQRKSLIYKGLGIILNNLQLFFYYLFCINLFVFFIVFSYQF